MKQSIRINLNRNQDIKLGDTVRLCDGSSLANRDIDNRFNIVSSYESVTGLKSELKHCDAEVIEVGVYDQVSVDGFLNSGYLQDIVIQIGKSFFRTSSRHVMPVQVTPEYTIEELINKLGHDFKIKK